MFLFILFPSIHLSIALLSVSQSHLSLLFSIILCECATICYCTRSMQLPFTLFIFYVHCNDVGVVSYSRRVTPPPPRLCVLFLHTHIDTVHLLVLVILLFFIYFQAILVLWPMFIVSRGGGFFGLKQPQKNCRGRALIEVRTENMT